MSSLNTLSEDMELTDAAVLYTQLRILATDLPRYLFCVSYFPSENLLLKRLYCRPNNHTITEMDSPRKASTSKNFIAVCT